MPETSRDVVKAKEAMLKGLRAGYGSPPSDSRFRFVAKDGTAFQTYSEMVAHNRDLDALAQGRRTFDIEQNRRYRRA